MGLQAYIYPEAVRHDRERQRASESVLVTTKNKHSSQTDKRVIAVIFRLSIAMCKPTHVIRPTQLDAET